MSRIPACHWPTSEAGIWSYGESLNPGLSLNEHKSHDEMDSMTEPHYSYQLPPELVDEIIKQFYYTYSQYGPDRLSNLCLVARHWSHTCRQFRFQEVSVATRCSPEWSENSFNDFLRTCPQVCPFIRSLSFTRSSVMIHHWHEDRYLSGDMSSSSLSETIDQLPNLQRLCLTHIDFSLKSSLQPAAQTRRHLQYLEIGDVMFTILRGCEVDLTVPTLTQLLQIFQSIDVLDIKSCYRHSTLVCTQTGQGPSIRSLHIGCNSGYLADCIDLKSVQSLCLRFPRSSEGGNRDSISTICKDCVNLQVLHLEFDQIFDWIPIEIWWRDFDWEESHIFSSPHLSSITFQMKSFSLFGDGNILQPVMVIHNTLQRLLSVMRNMTQKVTLFVNYKLSSCHFTEILRIFDWNTIITNLRTITNLEKLCFSIKIRDFRKSYLPDYPETYELLRRKLLPLQDGGGPSVEIHLTYPSSWVPLEGPLLPKW